MNPKVSIIITSKNEEHNIAALLKSIFLLTYKKVETILVDNNSTDKTIKNAKKFKGVKVYDFGPERSAQRNFGANKAKGKYLLFLDADMRLSPKVVEDCVSAINMKKIGGVVIPEKSIASNFWERTKAFERSFYNLYGDEVTEAARFFPKKVFLKVGGYDESITGAEDWDLPETVQEHGFVIARINSMIYHQEKIPSLFSVAKKKFYYGLKAHKYLTKHEIPMLGPKTVYFLRPTFYKQWQRLLSHPVLTLGMVVMLLFELVGGGLGYLVGRMSK